MRVTAIAHHLIVAQGKEVGAAMPLLAQLYPRIGTTAEHGLDVPAEMFQRVEHVFLAVIADFAAVDRDERGVFVGKEPFFLQ